MKAEKLCNEIIEEQARKAGYSNVVDFSRDLYLEVDSERQEPTTYEKNLKALLDKAMEGEATPYNGKESLERARRKAFDVLSKKA